MSKVGQFVWENGMANGLDAVYCYGHNAMVRVSALQEIGGFVEGYVSEDFATAVELASKGWHTRFVPLHTYEAVPENVRGFIKRQNKWTRGSMEFFAFAKKGRLTPGQKLNLLQVPLGHIINLLIPLGALLTVYGFASSPAGAFAFLSSLVRNPAAVIWSVPILRFLLVLGLLTTVLSTLVRIRAGVTLSEELRHRVLSGAISAVMIPYELKSTLSYFVSGLRGVPVTPKSERPLSWSEIMRMSRFSLFFQSILWFGIFAFNPAGAVFNATWLVPMLLAPLVLMMFNGRSDPIVLRPNEAPLSSFVADSSQVNLHLVATAKSWGEKEALVTPELESEAAPIPVAS
jgi:cellulose synthase/poly-beta-1,6-N-acetylglucosamine synthase-like glycosyltransferase